MYQFIGAAFCLAAIFFDCSGDPNCTVSPGDTVSGIDAVMTKT